MKKTNFNYLKLKGRIVEKGLNQVKLGKLINLSEPSIANKLNNKSQFSQLEILNVCKVLDIIPEDIKDYFFSKIS